MTTQTINIGNRVIYNYDNATGIVVDIYHNWNEELELKMQLDDGSKVSDFIQEFSLANPNEDSNSIVLDPSIALNIDSLTLVLRALTRGAQPDGLLYRQGQEVAEFVAEHSTDSFVTNIAATVAKYRNCSDKQAAIIARAYINIANAQ